MFGSAQIKMPFLKSVVFCYIRLFNLLTVQCLWLKKKKVYQTLASGYNYVLPGSFSRWSGNTDFLSGTVHGSFFYHVRLNRIRVLLSRNRCNPISSVRPYPQNWCQFGPVWSPTGLSFACNFWLNSVKQTETRLIEHVPDKQERDKEFPGQRRAGLVWR